MGEWLDEITKDFGRLKRVRWLASRFRAISVLTNCYKVRCFHLEKCFKLWGYYKFCKSKRFGSKNLNPKICGLPTFPTLPKISLVFQNDNLCVCSVELYIEENNASLEELLVVPGESFHKLCNQVITDKDGAVTYKEVALTLIPHVRNKQEMLECFENFNGNFNRLMGGMKNYIKQRFATFNEPPLLFLQVLLLLNVSF